jgi:hypothetical protein
MSDTPRTDAEAKERSAVGNGYYVHIDFARELERENAKLQEMAERMAQEMRETDHEFATLKDYDALRA